MPNFRKIISAVCAFALAVSAIAVPAMADEASENDVASAEVVESAAPVSAETDDVVAAAEDTVSEETEDTLPAAEELEANDDTVVYYDDDFSGIPAGTTLVNLASITNTDYDGYSFSLASSRSSDTDQVNIKSVSSTGRGNIITFTASKYNDSDDDKRLPAVTFTKTSGARIKNDLYVSFDVMFNNTYTSFTLLDGTGNTVSISSSLSSSMSVKTWYTLTIVSYDAVDALSSTIFITDANGNTVDTITTEAPLKNLVRMNALGVNNVSESIDNLKIMDTSVPKVNTESISNMSKGTSAEIATVYGADSVDVELSNESDFSYSYDSNTVTISAAEGTERATTTVTITAHGGVDVVRKMTITSDTEQNFADAGAKAIDIVSGNTTVTKNKETDTYVVSGDFTVPVESGGATVTWESSNTDLVSIGGSKATVRPSSTETVTLTATATYGSASQTATFVLDLSGYNELANEIVAAAAEDKYIYYAADTAGAVVKTEAADGNVIFSDLYLPTSKTVTLNEKEYTVNIDWDITADSYITEAGVISASDKDKHETTITKTISYVVDDVAVASIANSYKMYVQFDPEYVEETVKAAVAAANATPTPTAEPTTDPSATAAPTATPAATTAPTASVSEDTYLRSFLYDYQVKFDAAYDENFDGLPTSVSSSRTFDLPYECYFGSTLDWESSAASIIKISNSSHEATVTLPSSSKTITLTANIIAGSATPLTHSETVKVSGKSSGSSSGNTSSGGSTRSSSGGSSGGSISSSVITPITPSTNSSSTLNPNPSGFTDLDSVSWALTAINNLYVNGVINGKTSTTFAPNDPVTRAEFAKMLVLAFNLETVDADTATFSDVSTSNWASPYVEAAYTNGIITGYEDGSFMPDKNVTRQEMAVMVMRAATAEGRTFEAKTEAVTFTDDGVIASYAKDAISTLQQANVISGVGDGSFDPLASSTRAQACQMIYNVFNK